MPEYIAPGVYIEGARSGVRAIEGVSTSTAAFIDIFKKGPTGKPTVISSIEESIDIFGGAYTRSEASYGIFQFFINGGRKAVVVRTAGRRPPRKRAITQGLKTLATDYHNSVNILCIPAAANLGDKNMRVVYAAAIEYCEAKRSFLIIDIPVGVKRPNQMTGWMSRNSSLRNRNAAVYFPRLAIKDPEKIGKKRGVSPSGTIAGLFARTDEERGVWNAPAGNQAALKEALALEHNLTVAECESLNRQGINCIREFPDRGILCWGARTLEHNFDERYVNQQRLILYIEDSIYRGTQWAVFEPNDANLWAKLRTQADDFLQRLWRQGALQGSKPSYAFFVQCGSDTTTQDELDRGFINLQVGVATIRPAEFVIIRIWQRTG